MIVERNLTVHATCNRQSSNTYSYLVEAVVTRPNHKHASSLVPPSV